MKAIFFGAALAAMLVGLNANQHVLAQTTISADQPRLILVDNQKKRPPPQVQQRPQQPPQRQVFLPQQRQVFRQGGPPQQRFDQQSFRPDGRRYADGRTQFQLRYSQDWYDRRNDILSQAAYGYVFTCHAENPLVWGQATSTDLSEAENDAENACENNPNDVDQNGNVIECPVTNCW